MSTAYLAGGCFWCLEAVYQQLKGVSQVTSGYAGGNRADATYEQVSGGHTGHAEVVKIQFDPNIITYVQLLEVFWIIHDPTTLDRQGNDVGSQYRSAIFYINSEQEKQAKQSLKKAQSVWDKPIVTKIEQLHDFYEAESYHQNYFNDHPEQAYCQIVINPKLKKLQQNFTKLIRP